MVRHAPAPSVRDAHACASTRDALCRAVVGAASSGPTALRHVGDCGPCRAWLDALARTHAFLSRSAPPSGAAVTGGDGVLRAAHAALGRQLGARLARDLHALAHGRAGRPLTQRRGDLRRLAALHRPLGGPPAEWRVLARLLLVRGVRRARVPRGPALDLAVRLDPEGLDLALALLAELERTGARASAERLLARWLARPT